MFIDLKITFLKLNTDKEANRDIKHLQMIWRQEIVLDHGFILEPSIAFIFHLRTLKIFLCWNQHYIKTPSNIWLTISVRKCKKATSKVVFPSHRIADNTQKIPSHMVMGILKTLNANLNPSNFLASLTPSIFIHPDWLR